MTLTLDNENVPLRSAVLSGWLIDTHLSSPAQMQEEPGILWSLEVTPEEFDAFPRFVCESVRFPVRRWTELSGSIIQFEAPYEYGKGHRAMSVISIWDEIPEATLSILERTGASFRFRWEGFCFVEEELPFLLEGQALFQNIRVSGSPQESAETFARRLGAHMDLSEFVQGPIEPGGHEHCTCVFEPKN